MFALSFASDRDSYSRNARACSKSFIPQVVASRLIIALKMDVTRSRRRGRARVQIDN